LNTTRRRPGKRKPIKKRRAISSSVLARGVLRTISPDVATRWLGDREFLTEGPLGQPRRLRLRGSGPSLTKLIRLVVPDGDVGEIVAFLVESGAVRKVGEYFELKSRFVPFRTDAAAALFHTVDRVRGLVDTIGHNMACSDADSTWAERSATNRHIPERAAPVIHRYLRRRVEALMSGVDAYLRRWEVEPGSEPTMEISLSAAAHQSHSAGQVGATPGAWSMAAKKARTKRAGRRG